MVLKKLMRGQDGERQLSQNTWAGVAPILLFSLCFTWLRLKGWLFENWWVTISSFLLLSIITGYFQQAVSLHDAFIRIGASKMFKRDIVAVERGRFVVKLRDAYGERVTIRRWILTCKGEEELDEWLNSAALHKAS